MRIGALIIIGIVLLIMIPVFRIIHEINKRRKLNYLKDIKEGNVSIKEMTEDIINLIYSENMADNEANNIINFEYDNNKELEFNIEYYKKLSKFKIFFMIRFINSVGFTFGGAKFKDYGSFIFEYSQEDNKACLYSDVLSLSNEEKFASDKRGLKLMTYLKEISEEANIINLIKNIN